MSEPRIVTPQEAQRAYQLWNEAVSLVDVDAGQRVLTNLSPHLAHTVATEPDRTRAAVVKALREYADNLDAHSHLNRVQCQRLANMQADAIENGADL